MLLPASCPRLRNLVVLVGALLTCSTAFAQAITPAHEIDPEALTPCAAPIFAGTYHVATGTFTRPGEEDHSSMVLPGIIYNNSCQPTGFISGVANGTTLIDDGRVPSVTSPAPNTGI